MVKRVGWFILCARGTPAHRAHFVSTHEKAPLLKACGAHIFSDMARDFAMRVAETGAKA
jgi:hypothetical protein